MKKSLTFWAADVEHEGADGEGDTNEDEGDSIATRCWRYHNCTAS